MSASRNFVDPDFEDWQAGTLPLESEDRASQSLRSPDFQKQAPSIVETPKPAPLQQSPFASLAPPPEPTRHQRLVDDRAEAAVQRRDQRADASNQLGYLRYLKDQGVETQTDPTGAERIAVHEDGAPKFKPHAGEPEQTADGRWVKKARDDRGNIREVDLLGSRQYSTDPKTGDRYFRNQAGEPISLGVDDTVVERQKLLAQRRMLQAENTRDEIDTQQLRADIHPIKEKLKPFGKTGIMLQKSVDNLKGAVDPVNVDKDAYDRWQQAQARLDEWKRKNPDYLKLHTELTEKEKAIQQKEQAKRDRKLSALDLLTNPQGAQRLGSTPPAVTSIPPAGISHTEALRRDLGARAQQGDATAVEKAQAAAPQQPSNLTDLVKSPDFTALSSTDRVEKLKDWVDNSVEFARARDPKWSPEKEQAFRGQFVDRPGFWGALRELGSGIWGAIADRFPEDIARIARGGDVPLKGDSWADRWIAENQGDARKRGTSFQQLSGDKVSEALQEGPKSFVTSLAAGLGGAAAGGKVGGLVGAAVTPEAAGAGAVPGAVVGGVIGAGALSGASFYRLAKDQFIEQVRDHLVAKNPNITDAEWKAAKDGVETEAQKYGAWEAGPEALSQAFTVGLFKGGGALLAKLPGIQGITEKLAKNAIAQTIGKYGGRTAAKLGAEVGEELATETATQVGHNPKKEGTDPWKRWQFMFSYADNGKTVGEYVKEGGNPTTLKNGVKMGWVKVKGMK
jgi:hypothetical protein